MIAVKHDLVLIDGKASEVLLVLKILRVVIQNWVSNLHLSVRIKQLGAIELRRDKFESYSVDRYQFTLKRSPSQRRT